jgi:N4-gp56 family major capsid protein
MAYDIPVGTNFAALQPEQRTAWAMELWKEVRNKSFVTKFLGTGSNAMIQRITELNASHKGGNKAIMTLLANADYTGVAGDNVLQGKEDTMTSYHLDLRFDQFRLAHANTGRMADQKSIINFRKEAKDQLSYGLANIIDELAFLTLSGVPYTLRSNGSARPVESEIPQLEFADDVTAPTAKRHLRWDATGKRLMTGDTAAIAPTDKISYAALVEMKAYLKDEGVRGLMEGGKEYFNVFVTPQAMAKLRLDPDYIANTRAAAASVGNNSELFKGADDVTVDGLIVREYRHVFNTRGMAAGSKWGGTGNVDGARVLVCGAQALGMVDLGAPNWVEKDYDYENRFGIAVNKMFGFRKPRFHSTYSGSVQDFGVVALDVAV